MKRYYSHYTFIYPDIYLRNHIVEVSDDMKQISFFPFDREIERTEFYSGLLVFVPDGKDEIITKLPENLKELSFENKYLSVNKCFEGVYKMFHYLQVEG